jgi:hypothetical protein
MDCFPPRSSVDQEFREILETPYSTSGLMSFIFYNIDPWLSFALTADRGTGPPFLQIHPPQTPQPPRSGPTQIYKYAQSGFAKLF